MLKMFNPAGLAPHGSVDVPRISVEISWGGTPPSARSDPVVTFPGDRLVQGWFEGDALVLTDGRVTASVEYPTHSMHLELHEDSPVADYVAGHRMLPLAIGECLRCLGIYYLHGAVISKDGRGVLLLGDSEVGKSTFCYRAVKAGWKYVADDGVLYTSEDQPRAYPFYREFALDPMILEESDRSRAAQVAPTATGDRFALSVEPAWSADSTPIRVSARLERAAAPPSHFQPCSAAEVLREVVRQNGLLALHPAFAAAHLQAVVRLTTKTTTGILRVTHDLLDQPEVAGQLLAAL